MKAQKLSRPRKNRELIKNFAKHQEKKLVNAHLSKELRSELGTRSLPVRTGDTVLVTKGKHAGWQKKVVKVNLKKKKVQIEGLKTTKTDSTEIFHYIHPANLVITSLGERGDRKKIFDRVKKET
ncbi:MAG: 50S ribosomal protein L24 [Candidatus Thorarchaeota archaeon]